MTTTQDVLPGSGYDRSDLYPDLQALAERLLEQQAEKRDYIVDTRRMSMQTTDLVSTIAWDDPDGGADAGFVGGDHPHRQIGEYVGIPRPYYKRMQADAPELLDRNVNHWLAANDDRRMIRLLGDRVRAFLSDRYRRLDHIDLMEQAVLPAMGGTDGLRFQVASLTDEKLHINAILPGLEAEIRTGDVVQAGIQISNSEVGQGRLLVRPRLWRLVCSNGLLVAVEGMAQYHVGRRADETVYAIYQDDTIAADDRAFFLKVRDAVAASLNEAQFERIVRQLREAATGERIQNPVAATEMLAQRYDLSDGEGASVLRHLAEGGDLSRWGAINAFTAAAKDADSFERQTEMEAMGGALVEIGERDWTAVAVA